MLSGPAHSHPPRTGSALQVLQPVRGGANFVHPYPLCLGWYQESRVSTKTWCSRTVYPDMGRHGSWQPARTDNHHGMAPADKQVTYLSPPLTTFASADPPLYTGHTLFSLSFSPIPNHTFAHCNSYEPPGTKGPGRPMFSPRPQ